MNAFDLCVGYGGFALAARAAWEAPAAALFGPSGSGKSTLLEALAGVRKEVRGTVTLAGRRLEHLPARARGIGWVPQDAALFPHLSAGLNVRFAVRARGDAAAARRAIEALEIEDLLARRASELSGGERQRVAIARALASRPRFLLLDEPLASVDRPLRSRIVPYLRELPERTGVPLLLVTHDPLEVLALADHAIVLADGRVTAEGDPRGIFASAAGFGALVAPGAENVFVVRAVSEGTGTLRVATERGCELEMASVPGFPPPARVAIRAEDVMLAAVRPERVSAQNVLSARVVALEPVGLQIVVHLQAQGERWRAKVTARAVEALALAPDRPAWIVVKAHAVQPWT